MNHIDESTHLQLINAVFDLANELSIANLSRPLTYAQSAKINKARDLVRAAKTQARSAGILIDGKIERGGDYDGP
jgi:hypothetical protein